MDNEKINIPAEVQEEANNVVKDTFRLFGDHLKQLRDGLAEHNTRYKEAEKEIKNGGRRTNGRIV